MDNNDYGGSPVAQRDDNQQETMNFYDALREIVNGKKITKIEWGKENNVYGYLSNGILKIHIGEQVKDWIINDGDLAGTDYIIYKENTES